MTADRPSDNALQAAEIVARLRKWNGEMERSSKQLTAYSDHNPEMREAAAGSGEVARTLGEAADFIEAHMPSTDTQAAKVGSSDAERVAYCAGLSDQAKRIRSWLDTDGDLIIDVDNGTAADVATLIYVAETLECRADRAVRLNSNAATPSPVTDETALSGEEDPVERAAIAIANAALERGDEAYQWAVLDEDGRNSYRDDARAALASTPQPAVAEGVERVLGRAKATLFRAAGDLRSAEARETRKSRKGCWLASARECNETIGKIDAILAAIRQGQTAGEGG